MHRWTKIGFDVDDRCPVGCIDGVQLDLPGLDVDRNSAGNVQENRIVSSGRAQRKKNFSVRFISRFLDNQIPQRLFELGEHDDMAEVRETGKARPVGRVDRNGHAAHSCF